MNKLLAMAVLGLAVLGGFRLASAGAAPAPVDDAVVNAKIDARLHELLAQQLARRAAQREMVERPGTILAER